MDEINSNSDETQKILCREIIEFLLTHPKTSKDNVTSLKANIGKKYNYQTVIKNATILNYATSVEKEQLSHILKRRATRSISGVSVIAIMTKPLPCPGTCIYCPGQESQPGEKVAKSYTGREPAAMRSIYNSYNSFDQVQSRIQDLKAIGHKVDKVELIIMGGTFLSSDLSYQENFVKGAYEGVLNKRCNSLTEVLKFAETSKRRLIGLTIETRPDYCKETDVDRMLNYGTTRVEIGIQTIYDDIYKFIKRGHTTDDSIEAIRTSKDAGLKVNAHIMPNLPNTTYKQDMEMFDVLFSNPNYKPDMLKIYPCLVIKGTELYQLWKQGKYQPYSTTELIELIAHIKPKIPPYVRIQRIMRDIPAPLIEAGCNKSNLRQLVQDRLKQLNRVCNCIRCREYGISGKNHKFSEDLLKNVSLQRLDYHASEGEEIFLSFENKEKNLLIGFLRLRKPSEYAHRTEVNDGKTLLVREIRVVGELVPKDKKPSKFSQIQHLGYGKLLMNNAERIALDDYDAKKLAVISGIGVRDWFYELGYKLDGPYVSKMLT
ncbi:MAG: tRNA uridine(34) 5-carboxymethylaminomethyl modification radical SAM/GNAT enzyme Elp3 [Candidatus Thorarchaeota archaeon]